jgi:hypothetical protein
MQQNAFDHMRCNANGESTIGMNSFHAKWTRSSRFQRAWFAFQFEDLIAHVAVVGKTMSICRNEAVINWMLSLFLDQLKICDQWRVWCHGTAKSEATWCSVQ